MTIHPETAKFIRRGYDLPVFDEAVKNLHAIGTEVIVHQIIGLPNGWFIRSSRVSCCRTGHRSSQRNGW